MGLDLGRAEANVPINFTKDEINQYVKRFKSLDIDNKGYITVNDLRRYFKVSKETDPWCGNKLNPYLLGGLFHPYELNESIFNFRGAWCTFSFLFHF